MPLVLQSDAVVSKQPPEDAHGPKLYTFRLEALAQVCLRNNSAFTLKGVDIICGLKNLRKVLDFASV